MTAAAPAGAGYPNSTVDALIVATMERVRELRRTKGGEYAGDNDALANFRRNAARLGLQPEQIWAVYASKHWDSIMQLIQDLGAGKDRERVEPIAGRVDDLITYLILFKAMHEERSR